MLKKSDKNNVFQFEVPPNFRGAKGVYSDVIQNPMDLGTAFRQIDSKYRCVGAWLYVCMYMCMVCTYTCTRYCVI